HHRYALREARQHKRAGGEDLVSDPLAADPARDTDPAVELVARNNGLDLAAQLAITRQHELEWRAFGGEPRGRLQQEQLTLFLAEPGDTDEAPGRRRVRLRNGSVGSVESAVNEVDLGPLEMLDQPVELGPPVRADGHDECTMADLRGK